MNNCDKDKRELCLSCHHYSICAYSDYDDTINCPCILCLVKSMCTKQCNNRREYYQHLIDIGTFDHLNYFGKISF